MQGQRIAILGAGRSGRAAARLAQREGAEFCVYDTADLGKIKDFPSQLPLHAAASLETGRAFDGDWVVCSPGIPPESPFVQSFLTHGAQLIGEIEFSLQFFHGKIVAITGTNGKTTTTELIERMLREAGLNAHACGNYGPPLAEIVVDHPDCDAISLELSSFQLETIYSLKADVAIWLNFAPDHMDRYQTLEDYKAAKLRIFQNQDASNTAIVRAGEELGQLAAKTMQFSSENTPADFTLDGPQILFQGQPIFSVAETRMRGRHNAENCMAALGALHALGIPFEVGQRAARNFAPPLHRCELIRTLDGVEYINDSKATNLHALESALFSQDRPIVLLAGGKDKGLDYSGLRSRLRDHVIHCLVYGQIAPQLFDTFSDLVPTEKLETLEQAVLRAQQVAPAGSIVLLSPGTSSFDQFSGYEARGDAFRHSVLQLR